MAGIIEIRDLVYCYPDGTQALKGLNLTITAGAKTAILGPNGAGKSTLLLHLNGLKLAQQGLVRVQGLEVTKKTERWARKLVGVVFQDPDDQVFSPTVWEDVAFGPRNLGLNESEIQIRVGQALAAVRMEAFSQKAPHHLSYGQKKRVAIAGVLAMQPEILILDEPVAYLDPKSKTNLIELLQQLHKQGTTVIIATHDVDLAAEWADEVIIIKEGQTLAQGGTELLANQSIAEAAELTLPIVSRVFQTVLLENPEDLPRTIAAAQDILKQLWKK